MPNGNFTQPSQIIVPATVTNIQLSNKQNGSKKHLCWSKEVQLETSEVLASMSSYAVGVKIASKYLDKVGEHIKPMDVLETCEHFQISRAGYDAVYKQFKSAT